MESMAMSAGASLSDFTSCNPLGRSMESISIFSSSSAGVEAGPAARGRDSSTSAGKVPNGERPGASVGMSFLTISSSGPGIIGRTSEDFGEGQQMEKDNIKHPHCLPLLDPVLYCRPAAKPQGFLKALSLMADLMP